MIIENISPYLISSVLINSEKINIKPLSILEINSEDGTQSIIFQNKEYIIPLSDKIPIELDPENGYVYFLNQPLPPLKNKEKKIKKVDEEKPKSNYWLIIFFMIIIFMIIILIISFRKK